MKKRNHYNAIGIGIGPFNLSLAALLDYINYDNIVFIDKKPEFSWHEGLLLDESKLQISYLKDLVTLNAPTCQYSFLNYLFLHKRLYQFLNRRINTVSRNEFSGYMKWVSKQLPSLLFNQNANKIKYKNGLFEVYCNNKVLLGKNLILGIGQTPFIPKFIQPFCGDNIFHSHYYNQNKKSFKNKRVMIIGGGQSSAEILYDLISSGDMPSEIYFVTSRSMLAPLDDSCFSNEFHTPSHVKYFYGLSKQSKSTLLKNLFTTSNGITQQLIDDIYNKLYEIKFVANIPLGLNILLNSRVKTVTQNAKHYHVTINDELNNQQEQLEVDSIITCTGYYSSALNLLKSADILDPGIDQLNINLDYSLRWQHENHNKIFLQNASGDNHGITDTNLSLSSWRSATIINSLLGIKHFETSPDISLINLNNKTHNQNICNQAFVRQDDVFNKFEQIRFFNNQK